MIWYKKNNKFNQRLTQIYSIIQQKIIKKSEYLKKSHYYKPIASFLALFFVVLLIFVPSFKTNIFDWQIQLKAILTSNYLINGWILLFLIVFALIGFCFVLYKLYYIEPKKSIFAHHTTHEIKGAVWKWHWNQNKIEQLWCFCPTCNDELSYDHDHLLHTITLSCPHCKKEISKFDAQNINGVLTFVKNEIRRILTKQKK